MRAALAAEARGGMRVSPNPRVGAALLLPDGIIRTAAHLRFGGAHAERRLLRAVSAPLPPRAELAITLEPCAHHGKTPPCVDRIIEAAPSRVHIATLDPDPRVRGRGLRALRRAGIEVALGAGEAEALRVNLAFHVRHRLGRAAFCLKIASSLDGKLATEAGQSRWITGHQARAAVHAQRAASDAVLVGSGTVLNDDPTLNVRGLPGPQPSRIVVDSELRCPERARVWRTWYREGGALAGASERIGNWSREGDRWLRRPRLIVATVRGHREARLSRFRDLGWEPWEFTANHEGKVPLRALARRLADEGYLRILVEAGPGLAGALLAVDVVDELEIYAAPVVLGGPRGWSQGFAATSLGRAPRFERVAAGELGPDMRVSFLRAGLLERMTFGVHGTGARDRRDR